MKRANGTAGSGAQWFTMENMKATARFECAIEKGNRHHQQNRRNRRKQRVHGNVRHALKVAVDDAFFRSLSDQQEKTKEQRLRQCLTLNFGQNLENFNFEKRSNCNLLFKNGWPTLICFRFAEWIVKIAFTHLSSSLTLSVSLSVRSYFTRPD